MKKDEKITDAIALTNLDDAVDSFQWSSQTGEIFFSKDKQGNENSQIFKLNFDVAAPSNSIKISRLTHKDTVNYRFVRQLSNAKNMLLVTANHDDTKRIDYYHLDKENQKITNILINEHSFRDFFANKAGNVIIGARLNRDNTSTLYAKNNNSWNKLITSNVGENI